MVKMINKFNTREFENVGIKRMIEKTDKSKVDSFIDELVQHIHKKDIKPVNFDKFLQEKMEYFFSYRGIMSFQIDKYKICIRHNENEGCTFYRTLKLDNWDENTKRNILNMSFEQIISNGYADPVPIKKTVNKGTYNFYSGRFDTKDERILYISFNEKTVYHEVNISDQSSYLTFEYILNDDLILHKYDGISEFGYASFPKYWNKYSKNRSYLLNRLFTLSTNKLDSEQCGMVYMVTNYLKDHILPQLVLNHADGWIYPSNKMARTSERTIKNKNGNEIINPHCNIALNFIDNEESFSKNYMKLMPYSALGMINGKKRLWKPYFVSGLEGFS